MRTIIPIILSFAVISCDGPFAKEEAKSLRAKIERNDNTEDVKVGSADDTTVTSQEIVGAVSEEDLLALEDKWKEFVSPEYEKHCLACHQDTYASGKKWLDHLAMFCMPDSYRIVRLVHADACSASMAL